VRDVIRRSRRVFEPNESVRLRRREVAHAYKEEEERLYFKVGAVRRAERERERVERSAVFGKKEEPLEEQKLHFLNLTRAYVLKHTHTRTHAHFLSLCVSIYIYSCRLFVLDARAFLLEGDKEDKRQNARFC